MAQTIPCDVCGQVAADFLITTIHDGTVQGVGVECLLDWALPIAEAYAQAQAREQAGPGTQAVDDWTPPDEVVQAARDAFPGPAEAAEGPDGDWEQDYPQPARSGARRGRKSEAPHGREDPEVTPAAHDNG